MKKYKIVIDTNVLISALMAEEYIEKKAKRASKGKFKKALNKVADIEPEEYDK